MKALNHFVQIAGAAAAFTATAAIAGELQPATVHYGQGGAVTFFKPTTQRIAPEARAARQVPMKLHWAQKSIPNGSAVTYPVREPQPIEVAPLK